MQKTPTFYNEEIRGSLAEGISSLNPFKYFSTHIAGLPVILKLLIWSLFLFCTVCQAGWKLLNHQENMVIKLFMLAVLQRTQTPEIMKSVPALSLNGIWCSWLRKTRFPTILPAKIVFLELENQLIFTFLIIIFLNFLEKQFLNEVTCLAQTTSRTQSNFLKPQKEDFA